MSGIFSWILEESRDSTLQQPRGAARSCHYVFCGCSRFSSLATSDWYRIWKKIPAAFLSVQETGIHPSYSQETGIHPSYTQETGIHPSYSQETGFHPPYNQDTEFHPPNIQETAFHPPYRQAHVFQLQPRDAPLLREPLWKVTLSQLYAQSPGQLVQQPVHEPCPAYRSCVYRLPEEKRTPKEMFLCVLTPCLTCGASSLCPCRDRLADLLIKTRMSGFYTQEPALVREMYADFLPSCVQCVSSDICGCHLWGHSVGKWLSCYPFTSGSQQVVNTYRSEKTSFDCHLSPPFAGTLSPALLDSPQYLDNCSVTAGFSRPRWKPRPAHPCRTPSSVRQSPCPCSVLVLDRVTANQRHLRWSRVIEDDRRSRRPGHQYPVVSRSQNEVCRSCVAAGSL